MKYGGERSHREGASVGSGPVGDYPSVAALARGRRLRLG